ncbi:MAG: nicotinate phosphoribosyltransferase [Chloroflexi bacterium]|nr:nicotinate phosphoribosyltransferase [Chloroflexota bacterium]MDA1146502.1 nicotinate phosphoribosyltransferase [Chloroflexota bacterium]
MTASTDPTSALFVDLYELTMAQAYLHEGRHTEPAVFDLFFRTLPANRNFLVAAGLHQLLADLETFAFSSEDVAYLDSLGRFAPDCLDWLAGWRFTGDVRAMPEGTPVFGNEPLVEVTAPLGEAQLIETLVINRLHFATLVASKGVRVTLAAAGRSVVDFGARRAHGLDAAAEAARALYLVGFDGSSNVQAGQRHGVPVAGTMAHSYVQAHEDDLAAFRAFVAEYPDTILLVDTYDTRAGVEAVIALGRELEARGERLQVRALRIDSGDLAAEARSARALLDAAGLERIELFASGGLDEDDVAALVAAGAPYDGFGVGTRIVTSNDAPSGDAVYKLVALAGTGRVKLSPEKETLPGAKQVYRQFGADGRASGDVLTTADDDTIEGEPLLLEVMRDGRRLAGAEAATDLEGSRARVANELARLPEGMRALDVSTSPYSVVVSAALAAARDRAVERALE